MLNGRLKRKRQHWQYKKKETNLIDKEFSKNKIFCIRFCFGVLSDFAQILCAFNFFLCTVKVFKRLTRVGVL